MSGREGSLIYVIGPSGAGKDSLLGFARSAFDADGVAAVFAHRYITRPASAGGENHVALSDAEFARRLAAGCFALQWDSHGLRYGIGREIDLWMERGLSVVVNGSRGYLDEAARLYPAIQPVLISVRPEVLRHRLTRRGREDAAQIEKRLERASAFTCAHPALVTVDNSAPLEITGPAFVKVLRGLCGG